MKALTGWMLVLLMLLSSGAEKARTEPVPRLRALLIGCDHFLTEADTWPAAENNVQSVADMLLKDARGYDTVRCAANDVSSVSGLEKLIAETFRDAGPDDISFIYFSTHGLLIQKERGMAAALLLSDGREECVVEADDLQEMLDRIPGQKMLIFDACNSGAMIGKGLTELTEKVCFAGPKYRVLCSAGGSEASWYWQGRGEEAVTGASYFANVLTAGLGPEGGYAADINRDGAITLREAYEYLMDNCAVSTPHVYPQQDDGFVLFSYDRNDMDKPQRAVTDITFEDTLLTAGESEVRFSFTVQRRTELYYQIIYHQDGVWQFEKAQQFLDGEQSDGTVLPGRKARSLVLNTPGEDESGYAMIQLITREEGQTVYQGSRLLCVQPASGEVKLSVSTGEAFFPSAGQELPIFVYHDAPCGLSVSILDQNGNTVRRLSYSAPTRPEQLIPSASTFYWDGNLSDGGAAEPGEYTVQAATRIGRKTVAAFSVPFLLLEQEK